MMRVIFRQIGGFVPVYKGCELDIDTLSADEAARLQVLIIESCISKGTMISYATCDLMDHPRPSNDVVAVPSPCWPRG
jgi:hypothetical protein